MSDLIDRQAAIDRINGTGYADQIKENLILILRMLPSAEPEPLSQAYSRAVWTWLLDYQIKSAELKGTYSPYEVLSWVTNDWRKENG